MSLQSQAMVNRDLSDVLFASGDVDLMAAIIECEAGGEAIPERWQSVQLS